MHVHSAQHRICALALRIFCRLINQLRAAEAAVFFLVMIVAVAVRS